MILIAVHSLILLVRSMAYLMANHLSNVTTVSVKMERCPAKTVRKPAIWHPIPRI